MTKEQTNKALTEIMSATPKQVYNLFSSHIGHKVKIDEAWHWTSNVPLILEVRCAEPSCEGCEPLFEMDIPEE